MRTLSRNRQIFYYANYLGTEDVTDSTGRYTGEKRVIYTVPIQREANISAASGEAAVAMFGTNVDYDSVIILKDTDMTENSIVWIGAEPDHPHNYVVRRISRSLNHTAIAVREVDAGA